jgi:monoamine oxidase
MISRRQFIRQTSQAAGALALASSPLGNFIIGKKPTVIIIGAGFSGLAAGYYLHKKNIDFKILEARNRIGGRVFSFTTDTPERFVIELGAEWIGDSHTRIRELCDEFKLTCLDNRMQTHLQYKGGYYNPVDFHNKLDPAWEQKWILLKKSYAAIPKDKRNETFDYYDWWRYLKNNGCPDFDLDIRELLDSTDFGESIRSVSAAAALAEYADAELISTNNEMDKKIKGGNDQLAERFADAIGRDRIQCNDPVILVEQEPGKKAKITCGSGKIYTADRIICAIPTFSIGRINWQPGLPQRIQHGINELQYARINKHPVQFSKKFWKEDDFDMITDSELHYLYHATIGQHAEKGVLTAYSIGEKAELFGWHAKNDVWNKSIIEETLRPGFGEVGALIEKQWNYYWGNDEHSYGSYALFKPGQWQRVQQYFQKPFLQTYFAGEHMADWQGFMEGAINTGEAAAEAILQ